MTKDLIERLERGEVGKDEPHEIGGHRRWLARKLMDSMLTDEEAFGIVCYHPSISDRWLSRVLALLSASDGAGTEGGVG